MNKYLITFTSSNPITGQILTTTSPRATCPSVCPLRKDRAAGTVCYAENGHLGGFLWSGLDRTEPGHSFGNDIPVYNTQQLTTIIRCLAPGSVWRHNQAGDLVADSNGTIDPIELERIVDANQGRRGFTFTHHDVLNNLSNRNLILHANTKHFRINLSANNVAHADALASLDIAPVAVLVSGKQRTNFKTPQGRLVVICPARTHPNVTCSTCKLCTRKRNTIVGLPKLSGINNSIYREKPHS